MSSTKYKLGAAIDTLGWLIGAYASAGAATFAHWARTTLRRK